MELNIDALTVIRERSGMTWKYLAETSGVDRSNLHHIVSGERKATDAVIVGLARALKIPVTAIIHDHPNQPGEPCPTS